MKRINVSFTDEQYEQIKNISERRNCAMADVVREFAVKGLNPILAKENLDFVSKIMRDELRAVLQPSVERLASLESKTSIMAATATYLNAETINRFVPLAMQEDVQRVYEAARKKAVLYVTGKKDLED